jgi:hypothetical protein
MLISNNIDYQNNKQFFYERYFEANVFTLIILYNIKMDLEEEEHENVDWIQLDWD